MDIEGQGGGMMVYSVASSLVFQQLVYLLAGSSTKHFMCREGPNPLIGLDRVPSPTLSRCRKTSNLPKALEQGEPKGV